MKKYMIIFFQGLLVVVLKLLREIYQGLIAIYSANVI